MTLGKKWIQLALKLGWIRCEPAPVAVTEVSLDVRLGENFWVLRNDVAVVSPSDEAEWYYRAVEIPYGAEFLLYPQQMALGHTVEFCGSTVPFITTSLRTKSTLRRWGGDIAMAAGMGEPGYCSRWTLELHNSHSVPLVLRPGWPVGQLSFSWCTGATKYARTYNVVAVDEWTPLAMLPKSIS